MSYLLNQLKVSTCRKIFNWIGFRDLIANVRLQKKLLDKVVAKDNKSGAVFEVETSVHEQSGKIRQRFYFLSAGEDLNDRMFFEEYQMMIVSGIEQLNKKVMPKALWKIEQRKQRISQG